MGMNTRGAVLVFDAYIVYFFLLLVLLVVVYNILLLYPFFIMMIVKYMLHGVLKKIDMLIMY